VENSPAAIGDSETRLYYTVYRYYSPASNRWLTRDPLGMVDGPHVYAYVVGNPVTMWDALGQEAEGGGEMNEEFMFYITCLGGLVAELMILARTLGGKYSSMGQTMQWAAMALIGLIAIIGSLSMAIMMNGDITTARKRESQGMGLGGAMGIVLSAVAAVFLAETILGVLGFVTVGFIMGVDGSGNAVGL